MITTRQDGDLLLGPESARSAGIARVALDGATLVVDPAEPGMLGSLTIFDEGLVVPVLDSLWWHADPTVDASQVLLPPPRQDDMLSPSPDLTCMLRLGLLSWLETWSPDDIDPVLLDLEIGSTAAVACLAPDGEAIARERLLPRLPDLLTMAERFRTTDAWDIHPAVAALLRDAIRASHDLMDDSEPWFEEIEHEFELMTILASTGSIRLDWDQLLRDPDALLGDRSPVRAAHAGDPSDLTRPLTGQSSVDWQQVPRGLLNSAESTIAWSIDNPATSIQVAVKAATGAAVTMSGVGGLAFRVLTPDGAVVGIGPLHLDPSAGEFLGRCRIAASVDVKVDVDVFDPARVLRPRVGPAAAMATAERWSVRAVSLLRLAVGTGWPQHSERAMQVLQYASRVTETARLMAPSDQVDLLRARQAQLLDNLYALAVLQNSRSVRRRVEATISRLGREPRRFAAATDLTATEWALTGAASLR